MNIPQYSTVSTYDSNTCLKPSLESFSKDTVTGQAHSSYLVYTTGGGTFPYPGGVAGRFKGITTVFMLAVLLGKGTLHPKRFYPVP